MAILKFNGESYTVDHAVKGSDYIHGYDAKGNVVVAIEGISSFSGVEYTSTFMSPEECITEKCNFVKHLNGRFVREDGTPIDDYMPTTLVYGVHYGDELPSTAPRGKLFFKKVSI